MRAVAIPLFRIVQATTGHVRFRDKVELCDFFKIPQSAHVIASGTAKDRPLESWWRLESRANALALLRAAGVDLITTPNFSLFTDVPRWDNLHSMKRIAIAWAEIQSAGIAAALHVNARTEHDYERWADFVRGREEVRIIAVEFGTGAGNAKRIESHITWLEALAAHVGRPMSLIVRGAQAYLSRLAGAFDHVVFVDTESFIKTHRRKRAVVTVDGRIEWLSWPTVHGAHLDDLFAYNASTVEKGVGRSFNAAKAPGELNRLRGARVTDRRDENPSEMGGFGQIEMPYGWR